MHATQKMSGTVTSKDKLFLPLYNGNCRKPCLNKKTEHQIFLPIQQQLRIKNKYQYQDQCQILF